MTKLRVMSYNVHGCRGLDARVSPQRITRVVVALQPDVVALQEVFVDRACDQLATIAAGLGLSHIFCETVQSSERRYGHAILSRFPIDQSRAERLPGFPLTEPRSALWATANIHGTRVHFIATHLSLDSLERRKQIDALLDERAAQGRSPVVLAGDLNTRPNSRLYRDLCGDLCDAWTAQEHPPPRRSATWPALFPIITLDYLFVTRDLVVERAFVAASREIAIASDHRPVVADLLV